MSISDKLISMMNTVRTKYALTDKLGIEDVTKIISTDSNSLHKLVATGSKGWYGNQMHQGTDGNLTFISDVTSNNNIGIYLGFGDMLNDLHFIIGKRYNVELLIKGTLNINRLGNENQNVQCVNLKLDSQNWKQLSFTFELNQNRSVIIYGSGNKGDWFTISDIRIFEVGG